MIIENLPDRIIFPRSAYETSSIWFITLLIIFTCPELKASNDNYPAGARAAAMANMSVMYPDFWSVWHNQAGLGFQNHYSLGFHHENRFIMPESGLSSIGFTIPTSTGTFGISWSHFGYPRYNENKFGIAFGKALHERFAAGLQFDYLNTFIDEGPGYSGTVAIEAGILAEPVDDLLIGFHVFNPTASTLRGLNT